MIKLRLCTDCKNKFPLTEEFFYLHKNSRTKKYHFIHRCRKCQKIERHKNYPNERINAQIRNFKHPEKIMFKRAKDRALVKNIPFTITLKDIIIPKYCPILNIELQINKKKAKDNSPSLDQIDPIKGYIPGNVKVISRMANIMKAHAIQNQLKIFTENILNYINKK